MFEQFFAFEFEILRQKFGLKKKRFCMQGRIEVDILLFKSSFEYPRFFASKYSLLQFCRKMFRFLK